MSTEVSQANAVSEENTVKEMETTTNKEDVQQAPAEDTPIANGNAEATEESQDAPKVQENGVDESEAADSESKEQTGESSELKTEPVDPPKESPEAEEVKESATDDTNEEDENKESTETNEAAKPEETKAEETAKSEETKTEEPAKPEEIKAEEPTKPEESKTEESPKAEETSEQKEEVKGEEVTEGKIEDGTPTTAAADAEGKPVDGETTEGETSVSSKRNFNGKFRQIQAENTDAFYQAVGMPWLVRKMTSKVNPSTEIKQDGNKFQVKTVTVFMTKESKFTVGEDFEETGFGFKKETFKASPVWDEDKLVMNVSPKNEKSKSKPMKVTREMDGDRMLVVFEVGDVVCKRTFERKK